MAPPTEPEGELVTTPDSLLPDKTVVLSGPDGVTLVPSLLEHVPLLYPVICGPENTYLWRYLPNNIPLSPDELSTLISMKLLFFYTIFSKDPAHAAHLNGKVVSEYGAPVGLIAYLNIVPSNRSIEIGHVLFGSVLQRTTAATVATYLVLKYAFEGLGYERVEWKANNLNEPSKRAAMRLGFVNEGLFRRHMVVKGRRRDTWWASLLDFEWHGGAKKALELWMREENFDEEGKQKRRVEEIREGLKGVN